jgi:hypothetical protein
MERVASPNTLLEHIKSSAQNKEAMISVVYWSLAHEEEKDVKFWEHFFSCFILF